MSTDRRPTRVGRRATRRRAASPLQPARSTSGSSCRPGGPAGRGWAPRSRRRSRPASPTTRTAISARATPGRTATSTRPTPRRSSSPTTSRRSVRTRPIAAFDDGLLRAEGERGSCRVVCFSPRHDLTLGRMARDAVRRVIDVWADQTAELGAEYRWVQVFENRGEAMGASNPHPHGQIWAGTALPGDGAREDASQRALPGGDRRSGCCSTTSTRRPAASGRSSRPTTGWSSSRSGRPGRSRRWSSRSARPRA